MNHVATRVNQRQRTHDTLLRAAVELVGQGREVTMREIAARALVSEATAYRYFPDLATLLSKAIAEDGTNPIESFQALHLPADPIERVGAAAEVLGRHVLRREKAVRATAAAAIAHPERAADRPGHRFGLIDLALQPLTDTVAGTPPWLSQLRRGLSVVVAAEAFFHLLDTHGLTPDEAIATVAETARLLTRASVPS